MKSTDSPHHPPRLMPTNILRKLLKGAKSHRALQVPGSEAGDVAGTGTAESPWPEAPLSSWEGLGGQEWAEQESPAWLVRWSMARVHADRPGSPEQAGSVLSLMTRGEGAWPCQWLSPAL